MGKTDSNKGPTITIRDHVYDGIEEYDQKLPNWWLFTLYGAIAFSIVYWFFFVHAGLGKSDEELLAKKMDRIEAARLEAQLEFLNDETLLEMSRNQEFVLAGREVYFQTANCAQCHGNDLKGGIGVNLVDGNWIYGGQPTQIYAVIENGAQNGMPSWASLGPQKIAQVVAFVLSEQPNQ
ncbi:MAG: cbb3-type cytochrome c oxidase N-terminal domain-containing protein [Puniceicoccaceae bacterium]